MERLHIHTISFMNDDLTGSLCVCYYEVSAVCSKCAVCKERRGLQVRLCVCCKKEERNDGVGSGKLLSCEKNI